MARTRVVIIGAGFGGLNAAQSLRSADVEVTLIDRHNYHLFSPLLYQVASGLLDPGEIAHSVRSILRGQRNLDFRMAEVTGVDLGGQLVRTDHGHYTYDHLIVAAGSVTNFFGLQALSARAFGLKQLDDALWLRTIVLESFERAAEEPDQSRRRQLLTFVVAGGGPTGVEYAGALGELFQRVMPRDYPGLDLSQVRLILVEARDRVLDTFGHQLGRRAAAALQRRGVELMLSRTVRDADAQGVTFSDGSRVEAATVVWTAGVRAAPLAGALTSSPGRQGCVPVRNTLQLPGHDEVQVIGDLAEFDEHGAPLPMLAPVAIQQGKHAAANISALVAGGFAMPFRYVDKGTMATVGRGVAVVEIHGVRYAGFIGWLSWLFVHLLYIVSFRSKLMVVFNWAWNFVFYDRPIRLITMAPRAPSPSPTTARRRP